MVFKPGLKPSHPAAFFGGLSSFGSDAFAIFFSSASKSSSRSSVSTSRLDRQACAATLYTVDRATLNRFATAEGLSPAARAATIASPFTVTGRPL